MARKRASQEREIEEEKASQEREIEEEKARQDRKIALERARQEMKIEELKATKVKFTTKMPTGREFSIEGADDQVVENIASIMNALCHKQQKAVACTDEDH